MSEIKIISDSGNYHVFLGKTSVWLNAIELNQLKQAIDSVNNSGFQEGDFLRFKGDWDLVTIFATHTSDGNWQEYASISLGSMELQTGLHITANDCEGYKVRRATDEEKKILLDALDEHGYAWNPETKKVEKKAKTSPASLREANLKPFCKVLVRDNKEDKWEPALFVKISNTAKLPYNCVSLVSGHNSSYKYCIPYEGNEKLAFKTDDVSL